MQDSSNIIEHTSMELPYFFYCTILLTLASSCPQLAVTATPHNFTDLESLLAFKARIVDPSGVLAANWTTDTPFCSWTGVQCSLQDRRLRVSAIRLFGLSLHGTISPHLANLSYLSELFLANNSLTGHIPESTGRLPRLTKLNLEMNFLSGPVPSAIFNMSSLINMYVDHNNLSGSLPSFIMLPRLRNISLSSNSFTGNVAMSSFAPCRSLQMLSLSGNSFSGTIPAEIGSLPELAVLYLGENQIGGTIPASLGNLTKLVELDLGRNKLAGAIPDELGNLRNLQYMALNHCNLTGLIPTSLLNYSMIYSFDLGGNQLTGPVPTGIGKSLPLLNWLHLGDNKLTGGLEFLSSLSSCKNLEFLQIWGNNLNGALPDYVGNLSSNLQLFLAFENSITGNIPASLGNLTGLTFMSLHKNEITGIIPSEITRLHSLQSMVLAFNRIGGSIPSEIGLLTNLNVIDLQYNAVSGPIPDSLANISRIQYLWLHSNKLSSSIPGSIWNLSSLLQLYLSENMLNGSLSPQIENLKALTLLDLSKNQLSGNIPSALGELQMLTNLDLSRNTFKGQIPETFGGLISVTSLNLSHNFLSAAIPNSLANLSYLDSLDLSYNKLEGKIPNGRVFLNLSIAYLIGNKALCGAPLLSFPPCPVNVAGGNSKRKLRSLKYIIPLATFGVLIACLGVIYTFYRRRKVKQSADTDAARLHDHMIISHHELVHATSNFSEANLLGRGSFGSVFKGCLSNGLTIAVKVFNLQVDGASKSFDAECQVLRMVRHRNLTKILSVCSNLDFKALILQFMPSGSLEQWLYADNCFLSLLQRLNIMVDVALALEYLHHHHPHVVLHCDLKPTNVLLDEELVAHVTDFGISKLLLCNSGSMATASIPGTIGYIAPEYISTGAVSRMSDVYSFGILLLETFTGKRPVDAMFGDKLSLREWIHNAHPTAILDVVDSNLLKDCVRSNGPSHDLTTLQQFLSAVIELGLICSSHLPRKRIPMTSVVARLHNIKKEYTDNLASS